MFRKQQKDKHPANRRQQQIGRGDRSTDHGGDDPGEHGGVVPGEHAGYDPGFVENVYRQSPPLHTHAHLNFGKSHI